MLVLFYFFWQGPLHNSFCDPSTPFLFALQSTCTYCVNLVTQCCFLWGRVSWNPGWPWVYYVTEVGLELDPVFTSAGWSCKLSPTTPNSLTYFFENHKYKLNHLHVQKMNVRALYLVMLGCLDSTKKVIIVGVLSNIKSTLENIHILEHWAREKYVVPSLTNWFK